ncbi:endonuclease/exonuclease/phosphatase family protein [Streptomyces sp. M19]
MGDALTGTTAGPLDYDGFGGYALQATTLGELSSGGLTAERTRPQGRTSWPSRRTTWRTSPQDRAGEVRPARRALVRDLASPDVVALEEVQDDDGATDDGVVSAGVTLKKLTEAIRAAGGPAYEWRQIDPADKQDGGEPGGNIRTAFLFNPERVSFTDIPGGDATTPVTVGGGEGAVELSASPGRIDPANSAWNDSRKPLVGEFSFRGRPVFVVANHFNSKGGDQPWTAGSSPGPVLGDPARRAGRRGGRLRARATGRGPGRGGGRGGRPERLPVLPALAGLTEDGALTDLVERLPRDERYGYVYNGNSQVLDHILTSRALARPDYDIVHVNAEFADQSSDHDPQVVRLRP